MSEFEVKIEMLTSALEKKKQALDSVLNITENQYTVLSGVNSHEATELFLQMNSEKQVYIDNIIAYDEVFQNVFESISGIFDETAPTYRDKIVIMQAHIHEIMELDIKVRAAEQKNKIITDIGRKKTPLPPAKSSKTKLLAQYQLNNKKNQ